MNDLHVKYDNM